MGRYGVAALLAAALSIDTIPQRTDCCEHRLGIVTIAPLDDKNITATTTPPLSLADPSGSYALDLRDAWARAAVNYCLWRWTSLPQQLRPPFDQAIRNADLDGRPFFREPPPRGEEGLWDLPSEGILSFSLLLPTGDDVGIRARDGADGGQVGADMLGGTVGIRNRYRRNLSSKLEEKALQLAAGCHDPETLLTVAGALSSQFRVGASLIRTLCGWLSESGGKLDTQRHLAEMLVDSAADDVGKNLDTELGWSLLDLVDSNYTLSFPPSSPKAWPKDPKVTFLFFQPEWPTGHYVLDLAAPAERCVVECLLLESCWAASTRIASGAADVSQAGNYQCLRNESFNCTRFVYGPEWAPPQHGVVEFDISIPERPPKSEKAMREDAWGRFLEAYFDSPLPGVVRALCLRRVARRLCITAQQLANFVQRATAGDSSAATVGADQLLLQVLFFRIRDYNNAWPLLFSDQAWFGRPQRLLASEALLGRLNVADAVNIHARPPMVLQLHLHEDRQLFRMLLSIAYSEGGKAIDEKCFLGFMYGPNKEEQQSLSAPPDWWAKNSPPLHGVVTVAYAGGEGTVPLRKRLARQILGWES